MIEKERKFLTKKDAWINLSSFIEMIIEQGYLMLDNNKHLRVRIINGSKGYITYKVSESDTTRQEYEYEIPLEDAKELMRSTEIKLSKKRISMPYRTHKIDIDEYKNGLMVIEIEYENELLDSDIPYYCGEEITGDKKYSNINLALMNELRFNNDSNL